MLAVEIGFGDVKAMGEGTKIKFPTVLAYAGNGILKGWDKEDGSYLFNGKRYIVGKEALGHPEMFSSRTPEFLVEFAPLFLYKAFKESGIKPDIVALGLAVGYYSRKDTLARKVLSFEVNGEKITLLECSIFPQAVGIWLDWSSSNCSKGNYMVLDIGFNTVDVVFVKDGNVSRESSWMLEAEGMIKVVNYLSDLIQEKIGVGLIPHTAKWLLEKKSLTVYGKERNLEKIIAKLSSNYAERLFSILEERCGERLKHLDGIIVGGGGAYYIRDYIPRRLRNLTIVMEEPEFSNARGFFKGLKNTEREKR